MQEDTARLLAEFADPHGHAGRVHMLCDLLRLYRVCAFERCRKAQACRGRGRCLRELKPPRPVFAGACTQMLETRLPWIMGGRMDERVAYEAWVAAMEARSSSGVQRALLFGDPEKERTGFPLARE